MGYYDDSHGSVWRLAVHETGHGLMYVVHGGTIKALAVRPWAGENDGYCRAELAVEGRRRHDARRVRGTDRSGVCSG